MRSRSKQSHHDPLSPTTDALWPPELERRKRPRAPLRFRRIELKYLVPERLLNQVLDDITPWTRQDPYLAGLPGADDWYPVTSMYFDSWDLQAVFEKDAGMLYRRKLRLRTYQPEFSEDVPIFMEIKRRLDFVVMKDRMSLPPGVIRRGQSIEEVLRTVLAAGDSGLTHSEAETLTAWYSLLPAALVRYRRFAFQGLDDHETRVTLDVDLEGKWRPQQIIDVGPLRGLSTHIGSGSDGIAGRYGVLELKCNHAIPPWFHKLVQDLQLRRAAYSKYVIAVLSLRPGLQATSEHAFGSAGLRAS